MLVLYQQAVSATPKALSAKVLCSEALSLKAIGLQRFYT